MVTNKPGFRRNLKACRRMSGVRALVAVGMLAKPQNRCGEDGSKFFSNRVLRGGVATK